MIYWLFDVGNSRLKIAPVNNGYVGQVQATHYRTEDGFQQLGDILPSGDTAFVASVAPRLWTQQLLDALSKRFTHVHRVVPRASHGKLQIAYASAERLGVDRFLSLIAACQNEQHILIVGVGTALTIDLLRADGQHIGGSITPSPTLMRSILHTRAEHLPTTGGKYVIFAENTEDALASGCEGAAIALISSRLHAAQQHLGHTVTLMLHGGGAGPLLDTFSHAVHRPSLVIEGLAIWAQSEL